MGLVVRDAGEHDAADIARIGSISMRAQYRELVDPAAVEAAIDQSYSLAALTTCMDRCTASQGAHFLIAELDDAVVGYLHFDDFGPEPELHRIYVDPDGRGHGVGAALLSELHSRLPDRMPYMLLVMEGNDRAVAFYEHHGFDVDVHVDGLSYYRDHMGVTFPQDTRPFRLVLMRRQHWSWGVRGSVTPLCGCGRRALTPVLHSSGLTWQRRELMRRE